MRSARWSDVASDNFPLRGGEAERVGFVRRTYVNGAAISVEMPETQRYDMRVRRRKRSPSHPPMNVPAKPVTTATAPNVAVASTRVMPRMRSRNAGSQYARLPSANVYAP